MICSNNCRNGKCSCCGECCGNILPITKEEYQKIKEAIKKYNIQYDYHDFITKEGVHMLCPFLDMKTRKCKLHAIDYNLKPEVCKEFKCCNPDSIIDKNRKYYDSRADFNGNSGILKPFDLLFFDNPMMLLMLANNIAHVQSEEQMIHFLESTGNKDVADAIRSGKIKLDWSD